jgi:hypothetical protein
MQSTERKDLPVDPPRSARGSDSDAPADAVARKEGFAGADGVTILSEVTDRKDTAYKFSTKKKWCILTVVALCQTSMSKLLLPPLSSR